MRRAASHVPFAAVVLVMGCGASVRPEPSVGSGPIRELSPIPARDAIVRIVGDVDCTGAVIDDDLVLTARSCVVAHDGAGHPLPPEQLRVELGGDHFNWGEVAVRAVVAPACGDVAADGDLAVLVLARRLTGMPIVALRLTAAPKEREAISLFGFGRCPEGSSPIHRRMVEVGPIEAIMTASFVAHAALCPGDLGGPVFDEDMDSIGVLTSGALNGGGGGLARARFARVDASRYLLAEAAAVSRGAGSVEPSADACPRAPGEASRGGGKDAGTP